jgi:predicted Zn-dependent protease
MYRRGDMKNALPVMEGLIRDLPQDPYFWELKGQALLESGRSGEALAPLAKARELLPNNGLIQILAAQAHLDRGKSGDADQALKLLVLARKTESDMPAIYKFMAQAYGQKNDVARAELATAQYAFMTGDRKLAVEKAKALQNHFKHGSPEWLQANDIVTFAAKK